MFKSPSFVSAAAFLIVVASSSAVRAQSISGVSATSASSVPWSRVPNGKFVRSDCVHFLPEGATVDMDDNVSINGSLLTHLEACPEPAQQVPPNGAAQPAGNAPAVSTGWIEQISQTVNTPTTRFQSWWLVPWSTPTISSGDVVFIWGGLEPTNPRNSIMQGVLSIGKICAYNLTNGGTLQCTTSPRWQIESWLGTSNGNYYIAGPANVNPGDEIEAWLSITSESGGTNSWNVYTTDATTGAWESVDVASTGYNWSYVLGGMLEGTLSSCSELPADDEATFFDIAVWNNYPQSSTMSLNLVGQQSSPAPTISCKWGWDVQDPSGNGDNYLFWTN
jgi:hypothetical protein